MGKLLQNVPAPTANEEKISDSTQTVRRVEITVERRVCSIEVHGTLQLRQGQHCPVCGAAFNGTSTTDIRNEVK